MPYFKKISDWKIISPKSKMLPLEYKCPSLDYQIIKLAIEKGRHEKISREFRFCPFCKNKIECEVHFTTDCHTYAHIRQDLYSELSKLNPLFNNLPQKDKFIFILENSSCEKVASFIRRGLELREFLLSYPRGND